MRNNFEMYPMWYISGFGIDIIDPDKVYWADLSPFERYVVSKSRAIGVKYLFYRSSIGTSFFKKLDKRDDTVDTLSMLSSHGYRVESADRVKTMKSFAMPMPLSDKIRKLYGRSSWMDDIELMKSDHVKVASAMPKFPDDKEFEAWLREIPDTTPKKYPMNTIFASGYDLVNLNCDDGMNMIARQDKDGKITIIEIKIKPREKVMLSEGGNNDNSGLGVNGNPLDEFVMKRMVDQFGSKNLSFGSALSFMKSGFRMRREGWNGKGMFVYYVSENLRVPLSKLRNEAAKHISADRMKDHDARKVWDPSALTVCVMPHIDIRDAGGCINVGWKPSNLDLLSNDWEVA